MLQRRRRQQQQLLLLPLILPVVLLLVVVILVVVVVMSCCCYCCSCNTSTTTSLSRLQVARQSYILEVSHIRLCAGVVLYFVRVPQPYYLRQEYTYEPNFFL